MRAKTQAPQRIEKVRIPKIQSSRMMWSNVALVSLLGKIVNNCSQKVACTPKNRSSNDWPSLNSGI